MMPHTLDSTAARRSRLLWVALAAVTVLIGCVIPATGASATGSNMATRVLATTSPGWDIFTPPGYRYGPSIIVNSDGSDDMWTCSPGSGGPADFIRYRHSTDNGHTWSADQIVLQPTAGSADSFSTCDPGVVEFGGYYYLSYTSTTSTSGRNNQVFVARSSSATGPFTKWNGTGWGGSPSPFITYTGDPSLYGIGEPSLVVVGTTLYIYYTFLGAVNQTRVATASTMNANWPSAVTDRGVAYNRPGPAGDVNTLAEDSLDVKWVPALNKFIGVAVFNRLAAPSYIKLYESSDGFTFVEDPLTDGDRKTYAHNVGITGDASGHLDFNAANFISYAYGPNWGDWPLRLSPINFHTITSGAVADSFSGGLGSWIPNAGAWSGSSAGLTQSNITSDPAYITRQYTAFTNASYDFDARIVSSANSSYGVAFNFSKINPTDHYYDSGYLVGLRANGNVFLYKAGSGTVVGDVATGTTPTTSTVHVKVVQSGPLISVFVGGATNPQIEWADPGSDFPGGWDSFVTLQSTATFSNVVFSDNASDSFSGGVGDWVGSGGSWALGGGGLTQSDSSAAPGMSQFGNHVQGAGSYSTDVQISGDTGDPTNWVGLSINKTAPTDTFGTSGYLVYLRANGMVSLYRAGLGTVVGDTPTGTNPLAGPVALKVVEAERTTTDTGIQATTFAVYVGGVTTPQITWSDTSAAQRSIGCLSLDTYRTTASFRDFSFSSPAL
jgi:hypothetical protein